MAADLDLWGFELSEAEMKAISAVGEGGRAHLHATVEPPSSWFKAQELRLVDLVGGHHRADHMLRAPVLVVLLCLLLLKCVSSYDKVAVSPYDKVAVVAPAPVPSAPPPVPSPPASSPPGARLDPSSSCRTRRLPLDMAAPPVAPAPSPVAVAESCCVGMEAQTRHRSSAAPRTALRVAGHGARPTRRGRWLAASSGAVFHVVVLAPERRLASSTSSHANPRSGTCKGGNARTYWSASPPLVNIHRTS